MKDADEVARATAEWMLDVFAERHGRISVCLSGGSTPKRLYTLLATPEFASRMPWDRIHWFWGDERFVPPDDPASNQRMVRQAMFDHVPVPPGNIHPVRTTGLTPEASAADYERVLRDFHGQELDEEILFDVVLLGLGTNGHFASLFPDTPALLERLAWAAAVSPAGEPTRITLTYPALESCRHAAFLVVGADKHAMLETIRDGKSDYPAALYKPEGELHWFTDDAAEAG